MLSDTVLLDEFLSLNPGYRDLLAALPAGPIQTKFDAMIESTFDQWAENRAAAQAEILQKATGRKIMVTGASGQLGAELVKLGCLPLKGRFQTEVMLRAIREHKPDIIINCAALTNVDGCEVDATAAAIVNTGGPEFLSQNFDGYLVQISTDFVFDGLIGHYEVTDRPNPINLYGWSKLGGEMITDRHGGPHLIIRTTVLFSQGKRNFVAAVVDQLERDNNPVSLYNPNIVGTPTYVPALAEEILRVVTEGYRGLAHIVGSEFLTRWKFARLIAEIFGHDPARIVPVNEPPPGGAAPRPRNAGMICGHSGYKVINSHSAQAGLETLAKQRKGKTI